MKNKILICLSILAIIVLFFSCDRDYTEPIDIFEEEELTDPFQIPNEHLSNSNKLFVNGDRIIPTPEGYHVKGTIFSESLSGTIPITSGDFLVALEPSSNRKEDPIMTIEGYGTFEFPQAGIMQYFTPEVSQGSNVYYNLGSYFKTLDDKEDFPIDDDLYYFHYEKDQEESSEEEESDSTRSRELENTGFVFKEFYMDVSDPQVYVYGDYVTKKTTYENLWMGFSANHLFEFEPYTYTDRLEEAAGGTGFLPLNANFYFAGEIPIQKYQVKIIGEGFVNTNFGTGGELDFFTNCIEEGQFQMGCNGDLYADSELISIFREEYKLGKGTLQAEFSSSGASLRMAGEYEHNYLKDILGEEASKYFGTMANEGRMYIRLTDDLDDFLVYMEQKFSLNTFNAGELACLESVVRCVKDTFEIQGTMDLPYDIGEVEVIGIVESNGNFKLTGRAEVELKLTDDLAFNSEIDLTITQEGIGIKGMLEMPYGIGDVEVEGQLSTDGLYLSGAINSNVTVVDGFSLPIQLQAIFDSNKGVSLSGSATLPYGIAGVDVLGELFKDHLLLEGSFASNLEFMGAGILAVNFGAKILVSTDIMQSGVFLQGGMGLPMDFGNISVSGEISASDLMVQGKFNGQIPFNDLLAVDLSVTSSLVNGITIDGSLDVSCIASATAVVHGYIGYDEVDFSGFFSAGTNIDVCGISVDAGADLFIHAGSNFGVELEGSVSFPFGLGDASLGATLKTNGTLSAHGQFTSGIKIQDVTLPVVGLTFSGSTSSGLSVAGKVDVGFGLGEINLAEGSISKDGFYFKGGDELTLKFIIEVDFGYSATISNNSLGFNFTVVSATVDWDKKKIEVCFAGICLDI